MGLSRLCTCNVVFPIILAMILWKGVQYLLTKQTPHERVGIYFTNLNDFCTEAH